MRQVTRDRVAKQRQRATEMSAKTMTPVCSDDIFPCPVDHRDLNARLEDIYVMNVVVERPGGDPAIVCMICGWRGVRKLRRVDGPGIIWMRLPEDLT